MVWGKDSRAFTFEYNQRGHQVMRVIGVDAQSGTASALINEEAKTFIKKASSRELQEAKIRAFQNFLSKIR